MSTLCGNMIVLYALGPTFAFCVRGSAFNCARHNNVHAVHKHPHSFGYTPFMYALLLESYVGVLCPEADNKKDIKQCPCCGITGVGVRGTQQWHQSNSFYVHPWAVNRITHGTTINSAYLEKGREEGGLDSRWIGGTHSIPLPPFSSSLPSSQIPFHSPARSLFSFALLLSGVPQGTEGPALSE